MWNLHIVQFYIFSRDIRKFKDTKKQFDRVREEMELAQVKNAQAPRNKVHEAEEATQALILSRKAFRHLALDYVLQVNHTCSFLLNYSDGAADRQQLSWAQFYITFFGNMTRQ